MARFTIHYTSRDNHVAPSDPFVGYDEIDGRVVEATNPEYLGERMSVEEAQQFAALLPGAFHFHDGQRFYREY